jgi:hypothetical protein
LGHVASRIEANVKILTFASIRGSEFGVHGSGFGVHGFTVQGSGFRGSRFKDIQGSINA